MAKKRPLQLKSAPDLLLYTPTMMRRRRFCRHRASFGAYLFCNSSGSLPIFAAFRRASPFVQLGRITIAVSETGRTAKPIHSRGIDQQAIATYSQPATGFTELKSSCFCDK
jgi:hypothetical protein